MRSDVYRRKEWKIEKRTMETTGGEKENPTETQITREKHKRKTRRRGGRENTKTTAPLTQRKVKMKC